MYNTSEFLKVIGKQIVFSSNKYKTMVVVVDNVLEENINTCIFGVAVVHLYESIIDSDTILAKPDLSLALNFPNKIISDPALNIKVDNKAHLIYYEGNAFMVDTLLIQDVDNVSMALKLFNAGKIKGVAYEDLHNVLIKSMEINDVDLKNPYIIYEVFAAEGARDSKQIEIPHRLKPDGEYIMVGVRDLVPLTSGLVASVAFEDSDSAFINAIKNTKNNVKFNTSPLERVLSL